MDWRRKKGEESQKEDQNTNLRLALEFDRFAEKKEKKKEPRGIFRLTGKTISLSI